MSIVEPLENRYLMSVGLGTNLIVNGDAEADVGASDNTTVVNPSGWIVGSSVSLTPGFTAVKYGIGGGFPDANTPGPSDRGNNFFAGGPNESQDDAVQVIDLSSLATDIDAGRISADLSGWLGGFGTQDDSMELTMSFSTSQSPSATSPISAGEVTAADRNNVTEFLQVSTTKIIPAHTRSVTIALTATRSTATYNDAYADDISLTLSSSASTGFISGRVINDVNGNGKEDSTEIALPGTSVFIDSNNNGKFDKGEVGAKTHSNGQYTIANLKAGTYTLREILPTEFRATSAAAASVKVHAGITTRQSFLVSQTAVIGGQAFVDTNGDGKFENTEMGFDNVIIYFDSNDNGMLDSFEISTKTNPNGYRLTVPFGTYIIRQVVPMGAKQTSPAKPFAFTLTLRKGETSLHNNFAEQLLKGF